ncbi:hypothetical protein [Ornatilinea apprima]|uniref:hypothetical protein n=1 Tax=Ornatilinea apprima TaxID=1134406 RepID=UPI001364C98D|nr:hypothetical protein [Ornatilinea apprima]
MIDPVSKDQPIPTQLPWVMMEASSTTWLLYDRFNVGVSPPGAAGKVNGWEYVAAPVKSEF